MRSVKADSLVYPTLSMAVFLFSIISSTLTVEQFSVLLLQQLTIQTDRCAQTDTIPGENMND